MEVKVLLDKEHYKHKPQDKEVVTLTKRLPQSKLSVTLKDLADAVSSGCTWKASVMSDTTNDSFVASQIVALDVDNKNSYTSVEDFMALNHKYQPCFLYETFSSTKEHERFRVIYVFDKAITDYDTMNALYEEVWAQYPTVDLDRTVRPGKILFGGTSLRYFNEILNNTPEIESTTKTTTKKHSSPIKEVVVEKVTVTKEDIISKLQAMRNNYKGIKSIDINDSYDWCNKNIPMTTLLGIEEDTRFRCVMPNHEDNHPSARITTVDDVQVYFCTCEANGFRLITLLSKLLDMSENKVRRLLLENLQITYGSEYQRNTKLYVADLLFSLERVMDDDLKHYLDLRKLYETYKLIISFTYEHITYESLSNNEDLIVFFASKSQISNLMKDHCVKGESGRKLRALCDLGLLRKLTDSELRPDALTNANKQREILQEKLGKENLKRTDFYELVDLSPSTMATALERIKLMKDNFVKQRGNNVNRRINTFGTEEVLNNINVQTTVDTKKQKKLETKLRGIVEELLKTNTFFSESDLAKAYRATDKKHITKRVAEQVVLDFLPMFAQEGLLIRKRVNKDLRKQYGVPADYASNSFVFFKKNN